MKKTILITIAALFTVNVWGQEVKLDLLNFNSGATRYIFGPGDTNPLMIRNSPNSLVALYGGTGASDGAIIALRGNLCNGTGNADNGTLGLTSNTSGTHSSAGKIYFTQYDGTNWNRRYDIYKNGDHHWYTGTSVEKMTLLENGNLGIGATQPNEKLHIQSGALQLSHLGSEDNVSILKFAESTIYDEFELKGMFAGSGAKNNSIKFRSYWSDNIFVLRGDGNVGIGTTTPREKLEVKDGSLRISNSTGVAYGSLGKIDFFNSNSSSNTIAARIEGKRDNYSHNDGRLSFYTADVNGNLNEQMTINRFGEVGIGTTTPREKLEVKDGSLRISNSTGVAYGSLGKIDFFNSNSSSNTIAARIEGKRDNYSHNDGRLSFYTADVNGNLNEQMTINRFGEVGIGTTTIPSGYKLAVDGKAIFEEVKVEIINGADFVFEDDYNLRTIEEVAEFIQTEKHLPDVPSAKEMEENGIGVAEMNMKLLQKVEEMTLYMIEMKKENDALKSRVEKLEKK